MKAKFLAITALILGMVSCQKDQAGLDVTVGGEQEVMVNVSLAEATRATSADSGIQNVNNSVYDLRYILEVYDTNDDVCVYRDVKTVATDVKSVSFPVRLIPERNYNFVVWADFVTNDSINDLYYTTTNGLDEVAIITAKWVQMDEARDAYTGQATVNGYNSGKSINIPLTRPFGKLRVVTTDIDALKKLNGEPLPEAITLAYTNKVYTAFNALVQSPNTEASKSYTYVLTNVYGEDWTSDSRTLFTDYIFGTKSGSIQFTMDVTMTNDNVVSNNFNTEIPVKRNYLTTITGNILTDGNDIKVDVTDDFENAGGTNPDYEYSTISSDAEFLAALNAGGKFVVISDIHIKSNNITPGLLSTRAGNEPKVTTINLNGYTITVENKTNEAFATVTAGNTLFIESGFEGGKIVLAEGSTASFIENEGNVVLTSGEIKNNSTAAPVVDGTIVVNEDAKLNDDEVEDENKIAIDENNDGWLTNVLANGGTYVFTADMTSSKIIEVTADNVVLDGNGFTLKSSAGRAINVSGAENVTIKNLNIVASGERAINVIQNAKNVTIDNVTATAANYTVNVAGSAPDAKVAIKNSTLNGLCTVNVSSARAEVTVDGSTVNCNDNNTTEGEAYAALSLNKDAVGGKIIATNSTINVTEDSDSNAGRNGAEDGVVTIDGSVERVVVMVAAITYPDSDYYHAFQTIAAAIEFAKSGDVISPIRNIELTEPLTIAEGKNVVLDLNGKTISNPNGYAIENNGALTINGEGKVDGLGNIRSHAGKVTINGGTFTGSSDWNKGTYQHILKAVNTEVVINGGTFDATIQGMTNAMINVSEKSVVTINGGEFRNVKDGEVIPQFAPYMFTYEKNGKLIINDGNFYGGWRFNGETATTDIYGGNFTVSYDGQSFHANSTHVLTVYGGVFDLNNGGKLNPTNYVAEGNGVIIKDNTYTVLNDGDVLDLGGAEYNGTITVEGNVTIKGDTNIKTLKSTTGCTITIEDGKTLTLNNFSFGAKDNANAEYEIKGGTVTANYGFFQHGKYTLRSNFETGYMYYSYGSDITVYGTFHSQGKGDGLDYVRGKLTIAKGGKSIHDKSLWVGQPASWGAMNASLVIEDGGYVQANSLSVYEGSSLTYSNDADLKYNSVTGTEYITKK